MAREDEEEEVEVEGEEDARRYYDPDQPIEERREIRKTYRDLERRLAGTCGFFGGVLLVHLHFWPRPCPSSSPSSAHEHVVAV